MTTLSLYLFILAPIYEHKLGIYHINAINVARPFQIKLRWYGSQCNSGSHAREKHMNLASLRRLWLSLVSYEALTQYSLNEYEILLIVFFHSMPYDHPFPLT